MAVQNDINFPGAAAVANHNYSLFNPLDLYASEIYQKSIRRVPYMSSLSWLKGIKGRFAKRKVKRSQYSFYEEGQFMKGACTIAAISTSGSNFLITLSAADHSDFDGTTGDVSFPVEGMDCVFADGRTVGHVSSKDTTTPGAHVLTVKKYNSSQDIATVAQVGTAIVFYSNSQTERSGQTQTRAPQFEKITNYMQIIREGFDTSDVEAQNQMWFETSSGQKYLWYKGFDDTFERFEFQKEAALLISPQASGLTDKNGKAIQSAYGLTQQIADHGINLEYFNKMDGAAFDEMILALDNNYADKSYMVGHGTNVMLKLKDYLKEFAANGTGNISFSPFDGGQEQAINLNFKSYAVGQYEFYFQNWSIFSHKDTLGASGLPFRHKMIFMPGGMTRNADPNKAEDAPDYEPYIQLTSPEWGFAPAHLDKGEYLMWETGALASGGGTSDILERRVHMVAYVGLEHRCRHKFAQFDIA